MRYKIEVELAINHFRMLNEGLIDIGSLRGICNVLTFFLEESLSDSLVHNNQSDFGHSCLALLTTIDTIFFNAKILELFELRVNNLLSHGISNTISVNKNVIW